jgi:putative NADPH-quinone reductase
LFLPFPENLCATIKHYIDLVWIHAGFADVKDDVDMGKKLLRVKKHRLSQISTNKS